MSPSRKEAKRLEELAGIIRHVRRCFQLLTTISDEMIADLGLTASLRAVLEHLDERGPQTVPQIADEKSVRRQSIQALVDQLREAGIRDGFGSEAVAHLGGPLATIRSGVCSRHRFERQHFQVPRDSSK